MSNANDYLKDEILDHISTTGSWSAPANLYLALLKSASAAGDDTTTNAAKEIETPTANGYDREAITFGAASSGVMANTNTITHGPSTTGWSEATHYWITDALTSGNILFQGTLAASKTVASSGSLITAIGDITVTAS